MRKASRWMCLWPGLPGLWQHGQVPGLAAAVTFAMLLNLALIATLVSPGILGTTSVAMLWSVLALVWGISAWNSHSTWNRTRKLPNPQEVAEKFRGAQTEYLKGHWVEAESLLKDLVTGDTHDIEAQLLLATLYRRTRRAGEARHQLDLLERLEGAEPWRWEIARERQQVERIENNVELAIPKSAA